VLNTPESASDWKGGAKVLQRCKILSQTRWNNLSETVIPCYK